MYLVFVTDEEFGPTADETGRPKTSRTEELATLATFANAIFAGSASTFAATRSVAITAVSALLVALLGLTFVIRRRHTPHRT